MVVSYFAHAVLVSPWRAFIPSCPRVWQTRRDASSFTVQLHWLFGIIFPNDCHDRFTVFVFSTSLRTSEQLIKGVLALLLDFLVLLWFLSGFSNVMLYANTERMR
uniref:Uncharacterized protein n=1 Tax=Oryza punctata TaxID=4537 RepID=A0A0E0LSX9_ORYPU